MELNGIGEVGNELQLVFAGVALYLAAMVWRAYPRDFAISPGLLALWTAVFGIVLLSNAAVMHASLGSEVMAHALAVRGVAFSVVMVVLVPLAASLRDRRVPTVLFAAVVALGIVRSVLWIGTALVGTLDVEDGAPTQEPVLVLVTIPLLALTFGYLVSIGLGGERSLEHVVYPVGVVGSVAVGAAAALSADPVLSELVTGYVALPTVAATHLMASKRMRQHREDERALARRQRQLGHLARLALVEPAERVRDEACTTLADELGAAEALLETGGDPQPGRPDAARSTGSEAGGPDTDGAAAGSDASARREVRHDGTSVGVRLHGTPRLGTRELEFVDAVLHTVASAERREVLDRDLRHLALHDPLTGLPNRTLLRDRLEQALGRVDRTDGTVALLLVDLDDFKSINDRLGHPVGDAALRELAGRMQEALRPPDTVARLGADEFAVVVEADDPTGVADVAADVLAAVRRPLDALDGTERTTASLGAALNDVTSDVDELLLNADLALHEAKARGGDGLALFDPMLRAELLRRFDIDVGLDGAAARGEIVVHFQPVIDLRSGAFVHLEALARWQRGPDLLPPGAWIGAAERTGAISSIGISVVEHAIEALQAWTTQAPELTVGVNVAPRQLQDDHFAATFAGLASRVPGRLHAEVTESAIADEDQAVRVLAELRAHGVRIALDDFGTGYSSLAKIGRLPLDTLKIDRSLVADLADPDGAAIVRAIIAMADTLRLDVVAEGVETDEQRRVLTDLGCRYAQGFLFARPQPPDAIPALLGSLH